MTYTQSQVKDAILSVMLGDVGASVSDLIVAIGEKHCPEVTRGDLRVAARALLLEGLLRKDGSRYFLEEQPAREYLPFSVRVELSSTVPALPASLRRRVLAVNSRKPGRGEPWVFIPSSAWRLIDDLVTQRYARYGDRVDTVTMVIVGPWSEAPAWVVVHEISREAESPFMELLKEFVGAVKEARVRTPWRAPVTRDEQAAVERDRAAELEFKRRERAASACFLLEKIGGILHRGDRGVGRRVLEEKMAAYPQLLTDLGYALAEADASLKGDG